MRVTCQRIADLERQGALLAKQVAELDAKLGQKSANSQLAPPVWLAEVVGGRDERELASDLAQAAQPESPKPPRVSDLPEDRFDESFATTRARA